MREQTLLSNGSHRKPKAPRDMVENFKWFCAILLFGLIVGDASGKKVTVRKCGRSSHGRPRIVGGEPVKEGTFPWIVTLHSKEDEDFKHYCGGSILNERWILTAAHCLEFPVHPELYEIYVGLHRLSRKAAKSVKRHGISKIILHDDYSPFYKNDIALLKTEDPIDFSGSEGFVNGICLPAMNEKTPRRRAMIAGWGSTQSGGEYSDVLLTVPVPMVSGKICYKAYEAFLTENMLCAGNAGIDSCQGDSGGPLVMWRNGKAILIGIVSFGISCGTGTHPGVYTKVSSYIAWIEKTINSN